MNKEFKYAGFISYCHENKSWAKRLQRDLERYRIPVQLLKEHPELSDKVLVHVGRDETDLPVGGVLNNRIKEELTKSKKLIFVASTVVAQKYWPDKEVEYFASLDKTEENPEGRVNDIIPVIYEGQPNSVDPNLECYPESLRRIDKKNDLYAVNMSELSYDLAICKIIAALLDIDPDILWQRHRREARKEGIRKWTLRLATMVVLSIVSVGMLQATGELRYKRHREIARKAIDLVESGDGQQARKLLTEAVPKEGWKNPMEEPELAWALYRAMSSDEMQIHVPEPVLSTAVTDAGHIMTLSLSNSTWTAFLREWSPEYGMPIKEDSHTFQKHEFLDLDCVLSQDCSRIISSNGELFNTDGFLPAVKLEGLRADPYFRAMAFSPDGKVVAACDDMSLYIWDTTTGALISSFKEAFTLGRYVPLSFSIAFSPDGAVVAFTPTVEGVGIIHLDEPRKAEYIPALDSVALYSTRALPGHHALRVRKKILAASHILGFSADGTTLFTSGEKEGARAWDITTGEQLHIGEDKINGMIESLEDDQAVKLIDKHTIAYRFPSSVNKPTLIQAGSPSSNVFGSIEAVSPDGKYKAVLHLYDSLSVNEAGNASLIYIDDKGTRKAYKATNPDERALRIYETKTGRLIAEAGTLDSIDQLAFSPDSQRLMYYDSKKETVTLIDPVSGEKVAEWKTPGCYEMVFSPEKKLIASYDKDDFVYVWDYTGKEKFRFISNEDGTMINAIDFSPDGNAVVCAGEEGLLLHTDVRFGYRKEFTGTTDKLEDVCFAPDGKTMATLSIDGTVTIWNPATGEQLWQERFPVRVPMRDLVFAEDGSSITVFSWTGEAWSWDLPDFNDLAKELWENYGDYAP